MILIVFITLFGVVDETIGYVLLALAGIANILMTITNMAAIASIFWEEYLLLFIF